jgi:hypothetical protein
MKKYKRKIEINLITLICILIVVLMAINVGYSLWSSKLTINGKVTLDYEPQPLEVQIVPITSKSYTSNTGFSDGDNVYFEFLSDKYENNNLITTIESTLNDENSSDISVSFSMKNTSQEGFLYSNGKIELIESYDPEKAVTNPKMVLTSTTVASGDTVTAKFYATVDNKNLDKNTYYKYQISFDVDGVTEYFYYTIKIQTND